MSIVPFRRASFPALLFLLGVLGVFSRPRASASDFAERFDRFKTNATKAELYRAIDSLAQLQLGNTRLIFTPSQLALLAERADKLGDTVDQFVARVAAKLLTDVFMVQPATEGVFMPPELVG